MLQKKAAGAAEEEVEGEGMGDEEESTDEDIEH